MSVISDLQKREVNCVNSDLYSGQIATEKGHTLYFGFEKVDKENIKFWRSYNDLAKQMADFCYAFCISVRENSALPYPNKYSEQFNYDATQYQAVVKFIQKKRYFKPKENPFGNEGVKGGLTGMTQVLSPLLPYKKTFMVYASTLDVKKRHTKDLVLENSTITDYQALFGDIVMSFVSITEEDAPTLSHYGIFRNPVGFLDVEEKYKGLSMKVHGFAAAAELICFSEKKYMITKPMPSMNEILVKNLGKEHIHIGTNKDLKFLENLSENGNEEAFLEDRELLKNFPPIYHIDQETGIHKIAKVGTDLSKHLDSLPDEKTEFVAPPSYSFDFSGTTIGALKAVVNLEKLAEFYLGKPE